METTVDQAHSKPTVVFITQARFWNKSAGFWARTSKTIQFLAQHCELQVIHLGRINPNIAYPLLEKFPHSFSFVWLDKAEKNWQLVWKQRFVEITHNIAKADCYIIDKTELSFMLDVMPRHSKILVDTHDLISARTEKAKAANVIEHSPLDKSQEQAILNLYDGVICIQQDEYKTVSEWIGKDKTLYMPMPQSLNPTQVKERANTIGFIASDWHANATGLERFLTEVWPTIADTGVQLKIAGTVAKKFSRPIPQIEFLGIVDNAGDFYNSIDIAINPVFYGAGLKIKSVEALAHGTPLVTTLEGASGLTDIAGKGLLIANDSEEFAAHIKLLINNKAKREQLAKAGLQHIKDNFNEEACFKDLAAFLGISKQ